jgi:6-phosphogluconolactonase
MARFLSPAARLAAAALLLAWAAVAVRAPAAPVRATDDGKQWVYVGTYTGKSGSRGIYRFDFDPATGKLTPAGLAGEATNPSFLAIHPSRRFLYAVGEVADFGGQPAGVVSAFALDPATGKLTALNQQSSGGPGPCHVTIDKAGKHALVANYRGGSACVLPIGDDGRLGERTDFVQHHGKGSNLQRQEAPHAHSANLDAANRFAFIADLGLDKVFVYRYDAARGKITPNDPPALELKPGSGPRHFAFHPDGKRAYVINELASTITACDYDPERGVLTARQTVSTLPPDFRGNNTTAEVVVHPSGHFVYGSNRGHDSIAAFAVEQGGTLRPIGQEPTQGRTPRNFNIDPTGTWLIAANQDSNSLVVFRIDPQTGKLTPAGQRAEVGSPVCIKFVAASH